MASLNKVLCIGNVGREPEMSYSASGTAITKFSVAMNERFTSNGQQQERTEWANVVTFGKLAETCAQYLAKGRQVYVEGRMQTSNWEKDGVKHYRTEVVAERVTFLGSGQRDDAPAYNAGGDIDPDDLPF